MNIIHSKQQQLRKQNEIVSYTMTQKNHSASSTSMPDSQRRTAMATTTKSRRRRKRTTLATTTTKAAQMIILSSVLVAVLCGWFSNSNNSKTRTTTAVNGFALFHSNPRSRALSPATTAASTTTTTTSSSSRTLSMIDTKSSASTSSSDTTEFELQVGRALDTLRSDYPKILTSAPDYSIYHPKLSVIDPSGVQVNGLQAYKNSFRLLHALVKFIYCPSRSTITFRMCFDKARQNIRIHWNAVMLPREIFGGSRTTLHVDGISVYEMSRKTGQITQHRIEHLLFNSEKVQPAEGVIAALQREHAVTVPSFCHENSINNNNNNNICGGSNTVVPFQPQTLPLTSFLSASGSSSSSSCSSNGKPPSLFAMEATSSDEKNDIGSSSKNNDVASSSSSSSNTAAAAATTAAATALVDMEAYERKNKSRKKFGLKPLSVEEYLAVEADIQQMQLQKQQEQQQQAAAAAAGASKNKSKKNLLDAILDAGKEVVKDTCESNFDCERPEVCCDFGFRKVCCSSGSLVGLLTPREQLQPRLVPVPVDVQDPTQGNNNNNNRYPRQY